MRQSQTATRVYSLSGLAVLGALLGSVLASHAAWANGPSVSLNPASGTVGASFNIAATGFQPGLQVDLLWDDSESVASIQAAQNTSGAFSLSAVVPSGSSPGSHLLGARYSGMSQDAASTTYSVVDTSQSAPSSPPRQQPSPAPSSRPSPSPSPSPESGPPASSSGTGPPPFAGSGADGAPAGSDPSPQPASTAGRGDHAGGSQAQGQTRVIYVDMNQAPGHSSPSGPINIPDTSSGMVAAAISVDPAPGFARDTVRAPIMALPQAGQIRLADQVAQLWRATSLFAPGSPLRFVAGALEWFEGWQITDPYHRALYELRLANQRLHEADSARGNPGQESALLREYAQHMARLEEAYGGLGGKEQSTVRVLAGDNAFRQTAILGKLRTHSNNSELNAVIATSLRHSHQFLLSNPPATLKLVR